MPMRELVPPSWAAALAPHLDAPWFAELERFVAEERAAHEVFPAHEHVFAALDATPLDEVRVVLLGQDPYPTPGHAHGLCFSVQPGVKLPGSLRNMYKELQTDLGVPMADTGYLMPWARQGMLMLNTVLTVRSGEANSHKGKGWEKFTDAVIGAVNAREQPAVFVLWGTHAKKKAKLVDADRHEVIAGPHPSPLSAKLWFGSKPFSQIQDALARRGLPPLDWRLG
ncbi:MAG: uracil-DNA glycosylase [Myxococcota bacterium]